MKIARSIRILLTLSTVLSAAGLYAQTARVSGEVTDAQNRMVPGATIMVRNEATGVHRETRSNEAGSYDVPAVDPGGYTIRVSKPGFRTVERRGLNLFTDTNTRVDFQLKVGSTNDSITVIGDASLTQSNSPESVTEISSNDYNDLPLLQQGRNRSPAAFIFLAPSVQGNYTLAGAENVAATNQFIVNGSQMQVSEFYLDGAQVGQMRTVGSFNESAPAADAVKEFKITTTMLPAEYGHSGPAAGIFSIKSGTNRLRGSLYGYFRNSYLDATPYGAVIPTFTRLYEFGVTLGGPVVLPHYNGHNKTFFFVSYGGGRKSAADAVQILRVPTQQQISGVFPNPKYFQVWAYEPDPTIATGGTRSQVDYGCPPPATPCDTIDPAQIDPVAKAIASYFPAPNLNTTSTKDYQGITGELLLNPDLYTAKIDHELAPHHHLSATFVDTYIPRNKVSTGLPAPLNSSSYQTVKGRTARLNYDWFAGANQVNALVLGFNQFVNIEAVPPGSAYHVPGVPGGTLPEITFTESYPTLANDGDFQDVEDNIQARDVFRWQVAAHSLSFGGELRDIHFNDVNPKTPQTTINISDLETQNPNNPTSTGDALASFLLGLVDSASVTYPYEIGTRYKYGGLFAQDDWKILPRLTINLGLRWDVQTFPSEVHNHSSIVDLGTPNLGAIGPGGSPLPGALIFAGSSSYGSGKTAFDSTSYGAVGPRVGFAFQAHQDTVVRGGYGIFYSDTGNSISAQGFQASANIQSPDAGLHRAFVLSAGLPSLATVQPAQTPTFENATSSSTFQNVSYIDPHSNVMPRMQEWTLGVQQALTKDLLLEIDYVGVKGERLIDANDVNINQLNPKYLSLGSILQTPISSVAGQTVALSDGENILLRIPYSGFPSGSSVAQALRPYPQYGTLTSLADKHGYNNYNSLQVIVNKRYGHGLTLGGNYVWSKNLGISSPGTYGGGVVNNALQNAYNPRAEYSILPIDVANAVVFHYIYEFPFKRNHPLSYGLGGFDRAWNVLGDGWRFSGAHRYQSGYPLPILMSNNLSIFNYVLRPDVVPGVDRSTHKSIHGFIPGSSTLINYNAFATPANYFGNAKPTYGDVRNFPVLDEDFNLTKETSISERVVWNLYLQAFNALNRHRVTGIDTNWSNGATDFGTSSTTSNPRYVQIGTRFLF